MNYILVVAMFFCSNIALGFGEIQVKSSYDFKSEHDKYIYGLYIDEALVGNLHWISWNEYGWQDRTDIKPLEWFKTEQGIEYQHQGFKLGVGGSYHQNPDTDYQEHAVFGQLKMRLW